MLASEASLEKGLGSVTPSFEQGDLFVTNAQGRSFRLSWTGEEEESERPRALPAGEYALTTYRIVRDTDEDRWHISATKPAIQKITVTAGAQTEVEIDDSIRLHSLLGGGQAQMMIMGEGGAGLSIYRAGKRIPIEYRVLDERANVLASGAMRYG